MRLILRFSPVVLALLLLIPATVAGGLLRNRKGGGKRVEEAVKSFGEFMAEPSERIPAFMLQKCKAVLIFPEIKKAALGIGLEGGHGVMLAKNKEGRWSAPAVFTLRALSTGFQAGAESMSVILLVMKDEVVAGFVKRKLTLGAEASLAVGPKGEAADPNVLADEKGIYTYTRLDRGLFAGVAVDGCSVKFDEGETKDLYGQETGADAILISQTAPAPKEAAALQELLVKYSEVPES